MKHQPLRHHSLSFRSSSWLMRLSSHVLCTHPWSDTWRNWSWSWNKTRGKERTRISRQHHNDQLDRSDQVRLRRKCSSCVCPFLPLLLPWIEALYWELVFGIETYDTQFVRPLYYRTREDGLQKWAKDWSSNSPSVSWMNRRRDRFSWSIMYTFFILYIKRGREKRSLMPLLHAIRFSILAVSFLLFYTVSSILDRLLERVNMSERLDSFYSHFKSFTGSSGPRNRREAGMTNRTQREIRVKKPYCFVN